MTAENVGNNPAGDVGRPAGGERNDHRDRSRWIIFCPRAIDSGHHQKNRRRPLPCHYGLPDVIFALPRVN
jgi:hypothetical protein